MEVSVFILPTTVIPVIIPKPSARPIKSTNLAVGSLITPPTMLETIEVVEVRGSDEKDEVT